MSFRKWLVTKLFGFDPAEYEEKLCVLVDGMSHQVAEIIILKEKLSQEIQAVQEGHPSTEWCEAVQNAIKVLDQRTENMAEYINDHQEYFEHILSKDDSVTVTTWGLVQNNKNSN
jgi:hypothetical protein